MFELKDLLPLGGGAIVLLLLAQVGGDALKAWIAARGKRRDPEGQPLPPVRLEIAEIRRSLDALSKIAVDTFGKLEGHHRSMGDAEDRESQRIDVIIRILEPLDARVDRIELLLTRLAERGPRR